jgi:hypothetical protein
MYIATVDETCLRERKLEYGKGHKTEELLKDRGRRDYEN